jgi:hypothetical protein
LIVERASPVIFETVPVGHAAMIMSVVLSLLVGCGLMALLFYSSRHGYDEQHPPDELG